MAKGLGDFRRQELYLTVGTGHIWSGSWQAWWALQHGLEGHFGQTAWPWAKHRTEKESSARWVCQVHTDALMKDKISIPPYPLLIPHSCHPTLSAQLPVRKVFPSCQFCRGRDRKLRDQWGWKWGTPANYGREKSPYTLQQSKWGASQWHSQSAAYVDGMMGSHFPETGEREIQWRDESQWTHPCKNSVQLFHTVAVPVYSQTSEKLSIQEVMTYIWKDFFNLFAYPN